MNVPRIDPGVLVADNRVPLYHQIFLILRAKILDGEYGPGEYLPGERELGETFSVSRITAVRALNELAAAGLVVRERGRGTRVQIVATGSVARGPIPLHDASESGARDRQEPLNPKDIPQITIYGFAYVRPSQAIAQTLRLAPGELVQEAVRVSRFDGRPFNHLTTYVPEDIARTWTQEDLQRGSMAALLERAGVEIGLVEERVTATLADVSLAERLEVAVGSALIKIIRITFDANERPVDYFVGHYPPERYQYVATLPRKASVARISRT